MAKSRMTQLRDLVDDLHNSLVYASTEDEIESIEAAIEAAESEMDGIVEAAMKLPQNADKYFIFDSDTIPVTS